MKALRFILYGIVGILAGFIAGALVAATTFGGTTTLLVSVIICTLGGLAVAAFLNNRDGGVIVSTPALSTQGPNIDLTYLWEYQKVGLPWVIGFLLLVIGGALLLKWSGVQANYSGFIGFWIVLGIIVCIMPYSRYTGPDPQRLFPSSNSFRANALNTIAAVVSFTLFALALIWAIQTFNV